MLGAWRIAATPTLLRPTRIGKIMILLNACFFSGCLNFWVALLKLSKHILTFVNKLVTMNRSMILLNVHKSNILSAKGF